MKARFSYLAASWHWTDAQIDGFAPATFCYPWHSLSKHVYRLFSFHSLLEGWVLCLISETNRGHVHSFLLKGNARCWVLWCICGLRNLTKLLVFTVFILSILIEKYFIMHTVNQLSWFYTHNIRMSGYFYFFFFHLTKSYVPIPLGIYWVPLVIGNILNPVNWELQRLQVNQHLS